MEIMQIDSYLSNSRKELEAPWQPIAAKGDEIMK
jgi:hypothetical protein